MRDVKKGVPVGKIGSVDGLEHIGLIHTGDATGRLQLIGTWNPNDLSIVSHRSYESLARK